MCLFLSVGEKSSNYYQNMYFIYRYGYIVPSRYNYCHFDTVKAFIFKVINFCGLVTKHIFVGSYIR
jgi:hypothetical protein